MSEEKGEIYILSEPVEFAGKTITELQFRSKIKMRDMRGLPMRDQMLWEDAMTIAGRLCGQPDAFMSELGLKDGSQIWILVSSFLA